MAHSVLDPSVARDIRARRKIKSVLFTDMIGSTKLWERFGNVDGRLLINRHNRIIKPILQRFKGKIIKTIGDSYLAVFSSSDDALKAAIAVQQTLAIEKYFNSQFPIQLRIGIHTGEVILEDDDVFGDTVNVASRIEGIAAASEICVSDATVRSLKNPRSFAFKKKKPVAIKGIDKKQVLYSVDWFKYQRIDNLVAKNPYIQLVKRQKIESGIHLLGALCMCSYMFLNHLRFVFLDFFPHGGSLLYFPVKAVAENKAFSIGIAATCFILIGAIFGKTTVPYGVFRLLRGMFAATLGGLLAYTLSFGLSIYNPDIVEKKAFQSSHFFAKVDQENVALYTRNDHGSKHKYMASKGQVFTLIRQANKGPLNWVELSLGAGDIAHTPRVLPAYFDQPSIKMVTVSKYTLAYKDVVALTLFLVGFVWGVMTFRVRPY